MTALIIFLARWRHGRPLAPVPAAIDVALDHVVWLRLMHRTMTAAQAGLLVGATTYTWAEVVRAFAAAWAALPKDTGRGT